MVNDIQAAKALGIFSIALGAFEILAPASLKRAIGLRRSSTFVRAFGLREVAAGAAILTYPDEPLPVWARVAGDALDLLVLVEAVASPRNRGRNCPTVAAVAVLGVTALDVATAVALEARKARVARTASRARIA